MDESSEPDWLALEEPLRRIVRPLLDAGWRIERNAIRDRGDATYAASAAYELRRGDDAVEIEYLASDMLNLFTDLSPTVSDEDEPNPGITIDLSRTAPEELFHREGLLP
jgi:hypothetical protein